MSFAARPALSGILLFPLSVASAFASAGEAPEAKAEAVNTPDEAARCAAREQESLAVGGQAVMEGIMMRNGATLALAVRKPDRQIVSVIKPWSTIFKTPLARKRWVRGFPVLIETMVNGIKTLNLSAELAAEAEGEPIKPWQLAVTLIVAVGLALLLFVVAPHLLTIGLNALSVSGGVEGLSFHLWDGLLKFAMFIGYIASISLLPDIRRVFQYHGAEHKSIAAYEQGENPVTPGVADKYSRLHPRCGTTFLLFVLSISILLHAMSVPLFMYVWTPENPVLKHGLVILFKLALMAPISALAYEAIRSAAGIKSRPLGNLFRGPGLLLQLLTTRTPEKEQLEVGLVALREALGDNAAAQIITPAYERLSPSAGGAIKQEHI